MAVVRMLRLVCACRHAFVYDWRVWPVAEMRELMLEAGFACTAVCIDTVDEIGYSHKFEPLFTQEEFDEAIVGGRILLLLHRLLHGRCGLLKS